MVVPILVCGTGDRRIVKEQLNSRTVAREAERAGRQQLVQGFHRIERQAIAQLFSVAAETALDEESPSVSAKRGD